MRYNIQELSEILKKIPDCDAEKFLSAVTTHKRIFIYGAGRSGLMMKAFAMRLAQAGFTVYVVGETITPAIQEKDILILASASGKTASVLNYAKAAKERGATVYAITSSSDSALATISDLNVFIPTPTKDSKDSKSIMGTLFEQSVLLFCDAVIQFACKDTTQMRMRHANLE